MKRILNQALKYWKILPLCLLLALMAYWSWKFTFYAFPEDASGYTMETVQTGTGDFSVFFSYDNTAIHLNIESKIDEDDIQYYGMALDGTAIMSEEHVSHLTSDYTGCFLAVSKLQYSDYNNDGVRDRLHLAAKTDMEFSQSNDDIGCLFGSEVYPLEIVLNYRRVVQVYYNDAPLANAVLPVTGADGNTRYCITDEQGTLIALSARDAWKGFTISYSENNQDFYILNYRVEHNSLFTLRHLQAMTPFLIILAISLIGIVFCLLVRHILERKVYGKAYTARKRAGLRGTGGSFSLFMLVRWCTMVIAWVLVFYGGHIFGVWCDKVTFPILSCGLENENQFISGSCYYLANLDLLFGRSLGEIAAYFAVLVVSLLILGRTVCGFLCPMGLLQDVIHEIRQKLHVEGIAFNEKMYGYMRAVKWTFVILMIGLCFAGGKFCDICPAQTLSPAFSGFKVSLYGSGFVMVAVVIGSFFKRRFWCTICPLGFVLGLFHKISLFQIHKECQACTACGACYEACPMGIKSIYTERKAEKVTECDCIMCGECVRRCPENNALSITFCGKRIYTSSRKKLMGHYGKKPVKVGKKHD